MTQVVVGDNVVVGGGFVGVRGREMGKGKKQDFQRPCSTRSLSK